MLPTRVEHFDIASGRRELIRVIEPADMTGVMHIVSVTVADDPRVYAYAVRQQLSRLFLVQGAR